jgi:hypothetical protein
MVESVVCAAADALETKPATVRSALAAAFGRAQTMGLSVQEVVDALTPKPTPSGPAAKRAAQAGDARTG